MTSNIKPTIPWIYSDADSYPRKDITFSFINEANGTHVKNEFGFDRFDNAPYTDLVWTSYENFNSRSRKVCSRCASRATGNNKHSYVESDYDGMQNIMFGRFFNEELAENVVFPQFNADFRMPIYEIKQ